MPLKEAFKAIKDELEHEQEERSWTLYAMLYPQMALRKLEFMPFSEFYNASTSKDAYVTELSDEEIIEKAKRIAEKVGEPFGNI